MIQRNSIKRLKYLATKFRVVSVVGPRQSGKTTICKTAFPKKPYVSLENPDTAEFARNDARNFLAQFKNGAIIDEAQRVPELFSYIQQIVDDKNKAGMFILSGSNNFLMQQNITQSLAGRVAYLHLLPLSLIEMQQAKQLKKDYTQHIFKGFYPELISKKISPIDWYPNYIHTYVERDVRQLKNISNLGLFTKLMRLCAGRVGQILNVHSLANDCGIDNKTVNAWLHILQSSYIIYLLKPYYNNYNKRILQSPKLYFYDTGLVCSLLGVSSAEMLDTHPFKGALFENLIIINLLKNRFNNGLQDDLYYWRDKTGNEIDLLIDSSKKPTAIEIKSGATINSDYFKSLLYLDNISKNKINMQVCYTGNAHQTRNNNIEILPWLQMI
jgi:predicted AAA+ superfamily ATPase